MDGPLQRKLGNLIVIDIGTYCQFVFSSKIELPQLCSSWLGTFWLGSAWEISAQTLMICHFFSGGILCDVAEDDCGHATSTNTGKVII